MTAKLDGTAGLLQQYDYQTPTTGFSYTFAAGVNVLVMNPAGTLATGTITMPAAPVDGMTITVESTQQITALTVQGNTGQSLVNGTQTLRPNQPYSWVYRLSNTTWYPFAGATNSQIVSGVSQASTSGTAIDFTGIPSWVKRVTVMFQGVSLSATANVIVRLGTSGVFVSSGYTAALGLIATVSNTTRSAAYTTYFPVTWANSAAYVVYGNLTITNLTGNTWTATGNFYQDQGGGSFHVINVSGAIALSGVLTQLRITSDASDTFDAGSINILYE